MVRKIMQWVLLTALLLAVTWRPSANYQILIAFCGLCGCHHGDSGFSLYQRQNRDSLRRQQATHSRL